MAAKAKTPSENTIKINNLLQQAGPGVGFTVHEAMEAIGAEKAGNVTGVVTSLARKGVAVWYKDTVEDENGKAKEVSKFCLTEEGVGFDPTAPVKKTED